MALFYSSKPTDLMYVEGPGNIVEALSRWHNQEDLLSETSLTFSGQVFDFCKENNFKTVAISAFPKSNAVEYKNFSAFSKPKLMLKGSLGYYLSQVLYGLYLIGLAIKYKPKYFHVTNGSTFFFMLAPLKLLGIEVFPQFHNTLWVKGYPPTSKVTRFFLALDAWFLKRVSTAAFCCSPEIKNQIQEITQSKNCPTHVFKAQFYRKNFENSPPLPESKSPFVITFAGRIERNKGVFDILEMAQKLKDENIVFNICGGGSDLEHLRSKCKNLGLEKSVLIHGKLDRTRLLKMYTDAHTVVIPTRSTFPEGFAMVAAEAVLLERPIITSAVVPALELLKEAAIEVATEDVNSYVSAIKLLISDESVYKEKQAACSKLKKQFLDGKEGLSKVLEKSLSV